MTIQITFLSLVVVYLMLMIIYFVNTKKSFVSENNSTISNALISKVKNYILNIFYISLTVLIIFSMMMIFADLKIDLSKPRDTGIVLTISTVILFILFLLWDIYKYRIINSFEEKHQINLLEQSFFKLPIYLFVFFNGIIIIEFLLIIINFII